MLWMCIWMCPHHIMAADVNQVFGILPQIWASLSWYVMVKWGDWGCKPNPYSSHIHIIYIKGVWQPLYAVDVHMDVSTPPYGRSCRPSWRWNEVIKAIDPTHIHLTSMLYIYKVFDNLYMLWMCIWMCPHHVMAAHVDQAFGILLQIWASLSWYIMVKWGDWGCRPKPYSSHIHIIYIKGVWQPLYAVDVHMDVSTPRYGRSCRPSFGILPQIWASLSWYVMVKWGDWGYRPNPYSSHIHIIYIKVVWQPLYAVDVHMDVSTPHYGRWCQPSVWNFATNLVKSQLICDGEMRWLRL
jgi:hypothetical protein